MDADNVVLFVMDSLRADFLPDRLSEMGVSLSTVAQSTLSAPSFATLATGRYPQEHGVFRFDRALPDGLTTIFELDDIEGGFYQSAPVETEPMFSLLDVGKTTLSELDPPFVYLERDNTPHLPLDGSDSVEEYFSRRGNDWERMRADYRRKVEESVDRLKRRLETLEDRGLRDSTLVVATSDHGDLFGEYGCAAHTSPMTPELVRVPAVLVHPALSATDLTVDPKGDVVEHVDVVETALRAAGVEDFDTSGVDLTSESRPREWGYSRVEVVRRGRDLYSADGIWWPDGGRVFTTNGYGGRALTALYRLTRGAARAAQRPEALSMARHYLRSSHAFGDPRLTEADARRQVERFKHRLDEATARETDLDEATEARLRQLGYLDS